MTKKEVLLKIAGLWSGAVGVGAKLGKTLGTKASTFAAKNPKVFSSITAGVGGAALGAAAGALKSPGSDEFGQPKSRLRGALLGAGIGATGGAALGASKLGKGFGLGAASVTSKNPNALQRLQSLKKPWHPIRKAVGAGVIAGASIGASALTSKALIRQSNQVTKGEDND